MPLPNVPIPQLVNNNFNRRMLVQDSVLVASDDMEKSASRTFDYTNLRSPVDF